MKQLILLLLIFVAAATASSEIITGRIIDRDGNPIADVNIQTNVSSINAVSDNDGRFTLEIEDTRPSSMTFSHISFQPKLVKTVGFNNGDDVILDFAVYKGQDIRVTALRAERGRTPIAFADFTAADVQRDYTVADFPILLESTPNMYSFSYTGGAVGASDYKIRGFDSKRIGVYINGVPLNDPEDHYTYFYDLPDFAAEVSDIQVQRGVGNSLYGDASFGGSINISSAGLSRTKSIAVTAGYGRYFAGNNSVSEIKKQSIEYSSGLLEGRWSLAGRFSNLYSGGYRRYSWYDGWAYFFTLSRLDPNMTTTFNAYGGPFKAHLAFYGIDRETMKYDRRFNWSTYENEIDDFNQPHFELHNHTRLSEKITLNNTLYYIRGKGYYEGYKYGKDYEEYNIPSGLILDTAVDETDLIRQKWVAKNQYGWNPRLDISHRKGDLKLGGAFYYFDSEHWGEVLWGQNLSLAEDYRYYEYFGRKISASGYIVEEYMLTENMRLLANLQLRYLNYEFDMPEYGVYVGYKYDLSWLFFSPRLGVTYRLDDRTSLFFNVAVSNREPEDALIYDADYPYAKPAVDDNDELIADPERVLDFELGANHYSDKYNLGVNLYWMELTDEIILATGLDDDGRPRLTNADRSVHRGVELDAGWRFNENWRLSGNASFNYDRLKDYVVENDNDWDGTIDETIDYSGNVIAGFPEYLANMIVDFKNKKYVRTVFRLRAVGKQFIENGNDEEMAIDPYLTASLSSTVLLKKIDNLGMITLMARIDNLFNEKYELTGVVDEGWPYYIPAAERSVYVQLKWEVE